MDKNKAMITYLLSCPTIRDNPLFFNFINAKDNNNQIITESNIVALQQPYIDGSVMRRYTIKIILFKSISQNAVVKLDGYPDENVTDLAMIQNVVDWIMEQAENANYPDFGTDCVVDSIQPLTSNPVLDAIDTTVQPPLARYSISIVVEYLDKSKLLWKEN